MNKITSFTPPLSHLIAMDDIHTTEFIGYLKGRILKMFGKTPENKQKNQALVMTIFVLSNAIFLFALNLAAKKICGEREVKLGFNRKFFKHLILDFALMGGSSLAFNYMLSKLLNVKLNPMILGAMSIFLFAAHYLIKSLVGKKWGEPYEVKAILNASPSPSGTEIEKDQSPLNLNAKKEAVIPVTPPEGADPKLSAEAQKPPASIEQKTAALDIAKFANPELVKDESSLNLNAKKEAVIPVTPPKGADPKLSAKAQKPPASIEQKTATPDIAKFANPDLVKDESSLNLTAKKEAVILVTSPVEAPSILPIEGPKPDAISTEQKSVEPDKSTFTNPVVTSEKFTDLPIKESNIPNTHQRDRAELGGPKKTRPRTPNRNRGQITKSQ